MPKHSSTHNWLMEVAAQFGMSISDFCKCMGYSRQAIYQASCGMSRLDARRVAVSMYKLDVMNQQKLDAEIKQAQLSFEFRKKLIDSLEDRLSR